MNEWFDHEEMREVGGLLFVLFGLLYATMLPRWRVADATVLVVSLLALGAALASPFLFLDQTTDSHCSGTLFQN